MVCLKRLCFEALNEFVADDTKGRKRATDPGHVSAAMPGNVVEVLAQEGDTVTAGQGVMVIEAMKMEMEVHANVDGTV